MVDANSVSVVGNGILKQIKILESGLKLLPSAIGKREPQNYTAQAWTSDDRLIVGTDHGDILIVEGSELKSNLGKAQTELSCVESLCVYSKGFVVGSDEGVITLFEKTDDRDLYKRTRSFRNESNSFKVRSMALSPSEDALVIALDNSQLFTFLLSNADIRFVRFPFLQNPLTHGFPFQPLAAPAPPSPRPPISKSTDLRFEHMISSFHYGQVTGMEPAIRKPLLATCGLDKNIRIWNYVDRTLELFKVRSLLLPACFCVALMRRPFPLCAALQRRSAVHFLPPLRSSPFGRLQRQASYAQRLDERHQAIQRILHQGVQRSALQQRRAPVRRGQRKHHQHILNLHVRKHRQPPWAQRQGAQHVLERRRLQDGELRRGRRGV
jgi:hypothetical protein